MDHLRSDFPIFDHLFDGKKLIYFDSAATTQKPRAVLEALDTFYRTAYGPVHRSTYTLAEHATEQYEYARTIVAQFLQAKPHEIVFTANTTASLNIVALSWAAHQLHAGDEILLSELEHHSNLIPWQRLAHQKNLTLKCIPVTEQATLELSTLDQLVNKKTKLISVTHTSHISGAHTNVPLIVQAAKRVGARVCLDAAQSVAHRAIDVKTLDVDFLAFSGHKLFGPTGIGVLYINERVHEEMRPVFVGGGIINQATFTTSTFLDLPYRLEAGTPPVAQAVGLAAAITYFNTKSNWVALQAYESQLCVEIIAGLQSIKGMRIIGDVDQLQKDGHIVSFIIEGAHPHDIAAYLDVHGICVRAGTHCAQPLAQQLHVGATTRVSVALYNQSAEAKQLIALLQNLDRI